MKLFAYAFATIAVFSMGCAAEPASDDVTDEGSAEESADLTGKVKHHYTPGVSDVTWHPGCGAFLPGGHQGCEMGLTMTYTKHYVDLDFTHKEHVDNGTHTLTITVDSWSYATVHPMVMVRPETITLTPKNLQMSTHYKVVVKDRGGNTLLQTDIGTFPAP